MTWSVAVHRHGAEAQPVVVIEAFAPDPRRFLHDAEFLSFAPIGGHYPCVRAPVAAPMLRALLADLAPVAAEVFGLRDLEVVDASTRW